MNLKCVKMYIYILINNGAYLYRISATSFGITVGHSRHYEVYKYRWNI